MSLRAPNAGQPGTLMSEPFNLSLIYGQLRDPFPFRPLCFGDVLPPYLLSKLQGKAFIPPHPSSHIKASSDLDQFLIQARLRGRVLGFSPAWQNTSSIPSPAPLLVLTSPPNSVAQGGVAWAMVPTHQS